MSSRHIFSGVVVIVVIWLVAASTYTVQQSYLGVLFQYGKIVRMNMQPGLHFKIPMLQSVRTFNGRIRTLDNPPQQFLTANKRNVKVDYYVKWRIKDTKQYYQATGGRTQVLNNRLASIIKDGLRNEIAGRTLQQAVSSQRAQIMKALNKETSKKAKGLGIRVIDIRIQQIELPDVVSNSVYNRMRAEREKVAKQIRAEGKGESETIRADADKQRTVILADAFRKAENIRGQADAKATAIYAAAYDKDREFYNFYRSLQVYRNSWNSKQDMLVLEPDSELFKYFKSPNKPGK